MNFLDRLNLRPNEKRLVVIIFIVLFVVVNVWLVWPQFGQWNVVKNQLASTRIKLVNYDDEIARRKDYQDAINKIEGKGEGMLPEEASVQLRRTIDTQVGQSGVLANGINDQQSRSAQTNTFFQERAVTMGYVNTGEKELVDFLYNISKDRSTIRVRDLTVRPDQQLMKLQGSMTLVATYLKKSAALKTEPAAKPAVTNAAKPAPATKDTKATTKPAPTPQKPAASKKTNNPAPPPAKPKPRSIDVER